MRNNHVNKRILFISTLVIMTLLIAILSGFTYNNDKQRVYDNYGLLDSDEIEQAEALCKEYSLKDEADFVIVSTDQMKGKTSAAFSDDFFDYGGFGYDKEMGDGVLFLINMEDREVYISTSGKCIEELTDAEVDNSLDKILYYVSKEDYYSACEEFVTDIDTKINNSETKTSVQSSTPPEGSMVYPDGSSSYVEPTSFFDTIKENFLLFLLIALVLALIVTIFLVRGAKTKMTANSRTYMIDRNDDPRGTSDRFIRTTVSKTPIPKDNDSGGGFSGGGIHVGSSGNSHGGGGRSF